MSETSRQKGEAERSLLDRVQQATDRRTFLKWTGAGAAVLVAGACEDTEIVRPDMSADQVVIDFSDPATAIMNYAYALEQLEAAFYTQAVATMFAGATTDERAVLDDLRKHEVAHREFFKAKLGSQAIGALTPDFSAVNFSDRNSVLTTAQTFEDLGVSAYNGAGQFIPTSATNLIMAAGEIVSVEARHAAAIRMLLQQPSDYFSVVDNDGLDVVRVPSEVLPLAQPFVQTQIVVRNLPAGA